METVNTMMAAKKFTIALLLSAHLIPLVAVIAVPSVAFAQSTKEECEKTPGNTWTEPTDNGAGMINPGSCAKAGASMTPNLPTGWFYNSIIVPLVSWLSSLFLDIGAAFLRLAGYFFDVLIRLVVIEFSQTLKNIGASDAITTGWTVFRDFSNILIIGFFVFIAISIILGLTTFGDKRLIANVLVIAVLMNFSLLFTKVIIDGSNLIAYQVYAQMASANGATATQFNIAEGFLAPMKVGTVWNTYGLVESVAKSSGGGVGQAFLFALVGGILLLAVAAVLFYGCFLIAWRGILFIILMLTAPLAFATYLIPTLAKGEYGWDSWWKMLLNNAAFGPLLMIMLALSLSIINAAGKKATTPIGNIISDPSKVSGDAWVTIFVYFIGIGLLFVSFKMASSFAGSIGGGYGFARGLASLLPVAALRTPSLLKHAPLIGNRSYYGRAHQAEADMEAEAKVQQRNKLLGLKTDYSRLTDLALKKTKLEQKAGRTYDPMNTAVGQAIGKALGAPASVLTKSVSELEAAKKVAEHAAKEASSVAISKESAEQIAREMKKGEQEPDRSSLAQEKARHEETLKVQTAAADTAKHNEQLLERLTKAQEANAEAARVATENKARAEDDYAAAPAHTKAAAKAARDSAIHDEDERIKDAAQRVRAIQDRIDYHDKPLEATKAKIDSINRKLGNLDQELDTHVRTAANAIQKSSVEAAQHVAAELTQDSFSRTLSRAFNVAPDSIAASKARSMTGKKIKVKDIVERRKQESEDIKAAGEDVT